MDVFLVASTTGTDISDTVTHAFERNERYRLSGQVWLVARKGIDTSSEAFEALRGVARKRSADPDSFMAVVVPTGSYYGFGNVAIWQWVNSRRRSSAS